MENKIDTLSIYPISSTSHAQRNFKKHVLNCLKELGKENCSYSSKIKIYPIPKNIETSNSDLGKIIRDNRIDILNLYHNSEAHSNEVIIVSCRWKTQITEAFYFIEK